MTIHEAPVSLSPSLVTPVVTGSQRGPLSPFANSGLGVLANHLPVWERGRGHIYPGAYP